MNTRRYPLSLLTLARWLFAAALLGLGLLSVFSGDFALNWQPVPNWLPARAVLARISGFLLLGGGIGMLLEPFAIPCAYAMSLYWLISALLVHGTRVVQNPLDLAVWLGCAENMLMACGGWMIFRSLAASLPDSLHVTRAVVSISYIIFGVSHFRYVSATAGMVPQWLPSHTAFALVTGAGHVAAGLALLVGIVPRMAATLEAAMITSFVLLLHLPAAFHAPASRLQWTMVFIASTMAASAWALAASLKAESQTAPATIATTLADNERRWSLFQELDRRT